MEAIKRQKPIPRDVRKKLPKAKLLHIEWGHGPFGPYWARFRHANCIRWQLGWFSIDHRAPWLPHAARALYPHLFDEFENGGEVMAYGETQVENQRLREALQEIANFSDGHGRASWEQKKIALKALEATNEK